MKLGEQERRRLLQGGEISKIELKAAIPCPVEMAERSCSVAYARLEVLHLCGYSLLASCSRVSS